MTDSRNLRRPGLPDSVHEQVRAGALLLRLATTRNREGILDGAWWPRSRDAGAQLPGLISALTEYLGSIDRVGLDARAWDEVPVRLVVDDRVVHVDSHPVGDDTLLITCGDRDLFVLLVVPPDASPPAAREAMSRAVDVGNVAQAEQILVDTSIRSTGTGSAAERKAGREHREQA
ncbi:DUF5994 family protein [Streptomyces meridianus]|uniref:DUF5994 family protein n=1 Tax=Streptomyces meridianus TaxID=2938945 RepID=A0ABT0X659_9ACTN|nr:DUF5994 family protein [Streptomyces meridianus]MCM2577815.1 DUF5994 family protein [Streptomyces meridianus]